MQGPTATGPNGSPSSPAFDLPGGNLQKINFGPSDNNAPDHDFSGSTQNSANAAVLKTTSATTSTPGPILLADSGAGLNPEPLFVPPPPPPPPPPAIGAPVITTTVPAQDNALSIDIAGTAPASATVTLANNGSPIGTTAADGTGHWAMDSIVLSNGANYNFTATATDASSNTSAPSNSLAFHVDQTPPAAVATVTALSADTGSSSSDFITNVAAQTVSGTFTGALGAGEKIQVSADGGTTWIDATTVGATWSASGVTLSAGTGALSVRSIDTANNTTVGTGHGYTLDNTVPAAGTLSFANLTDTGSSASDFITKDATFDLALAGQETATGTTVAYQVSLNGGTFAATSPNLSNLADGDYVFRAVVTDAAGNSSTSNTIEVKVDNTPPAAGTLSFANLTDTGSSASDFITKDATFDLALAGQETATGTTVAYQVSLNGGTFAATSPNLSNLADGDYVFRAVVTDAAGNSSTSNTIEVKVDNTVPAAVATVTALSADTGTAGDFITNVAAQTVSGTFTGALGAGEKIQVSADGGTTWVDATTVGTNWSASGVTLSAGTNTLSVQTIDTAGNTTSGTGHSYTLQTTGPAAVATVTALSADTGSSSSDFITNVAAQTVSGTFTGALGAGEKIQVSADGSTTWIDATTVGATWSASGVTLSAGTGALSVRSIDTANNTTVGTGHGYTLDNTLRRPGR